MSIELTDAEIKEALENCAAEPVHIPGIVQPFGCLIGVDTETNVINYASENVETFLGQSAKALLGQHAPDVLGEKVWHDLLNVMGRSEISEKALPVGEYKLNDEDCAVRLHRSGDHFVIEIEPDTDVGLSGANSLKTLSYLMSQIQACSTEQELYDLTCELMQHLSGYDRVLIYRFDVEYNGEVLAEVKRAAQESYMGLRFPNWDIPEQARAIMAKLPLRFIQDVDQTPVPILAPANAPPLDISLAETRGVSSVHMEYLRNMGTASTMTLSVVSEGHLWGIISFHNRRPKVPAPGLRSILISFLAVFSGKLLTLRQQAALSRIQTLDGGFVGQREGEQSLDALIPSSAPLILDVFQAQGIAAFSMGDFVEHGSVPDPEVLEALSELAIKSGNILTIPSLKEKFPEFKDKLGKSAGALVVGVMPDRAICIFRNELEQEVAWAGNPSKTIDQVEGKFRLAPRGSFSTYLEKSKWRCEPWSESDTYLVRHLRTLLHAAERQSMMERLNRQQVLMIGELNHRVRNILALVRSVSRQARRRYGSLNSYANAIENRIRAMAAAHDISGGRSNSPVAMRDLIQLEFEPYRSIADVQVMIEGEGRNMRPEMAPIFSLVVHELTTNAAKYGAMSVPEGRVNVTIATERDEVVVEWKESGGPNVSAVNEQGFGLAMIEQAVPHEMGGTAEVNFLPGGLTAKFVLPGKHFTSEKSVSLPKSRPKLDITSQEPQMLPEKMQKMAALVLEDNFIIAKETADLLRELGCEQVFTCSNEADAMEVLESGEIGFAVLDVNLGLDQSSLPFALKLQEAGVPFLFVTGYGEDAIVEPGLENVPRLTKPIMSAEFSLAAAKLV